MSSAVCDLSQWLARMRHVAEQSITAHNTNLRDDVREVDVLDAGRIHGRDAAHPDLDLLVPVGRKEWQESETEHLNG